MVDMPAYPNRRRRSFTVEQVLTEEERELQHEKYTILGGNEGEPQFKHGLAY